MLCAVKGAKYSVGTVNVECVCVSLYRDAFPREQQFNIVSKYIVDQTQTASVKVCLSLCLSRCLCLSVSLSLSVYLCVCLSVSVLLSVCLSVICSSVILCLYSEVCVVCATTDIQKAVVARFATS